MYLLTDESSEKKLSEFLQGEKKVAYKSFRDLWKNFSKLPDEDRYKAILRIFLFAEYWDSSHYSNKDALPDVVWREVCKLKVQDRIFKECDYYCITFAATSLNIGNVTRDNLLTRMLNRARDFFQEGEMSNLVLKACIQIFYMHDTFYRGELINSNKSVSHLEVLKHYCQTKKIFKLNNSPDSRKINQLLGKEPSNIESMIDSLISKIKKKKTRHALNTGEEKFSTLLDKCAIKGKTFSIKNFCQHTDKLKAAFRYFLIALYKVEKVWFSIQGEIESSVGDVKKLLLKKHGYHFIIFAIDEVIHGSELPLTRVLTIAKDCLNEREMICMLNKACKYIMDQRNKFSEGIAFDSTKAFNFLLKGLNSIGCKQYTKKVSALLMNKIKMECPLSDDCHYKSILFDKSEMKDSIDNTTKSEVKRHLSINLDKTVKQRAIQVLIAWR